jgi:hypothetical protein
MSHEQQCIDDVLITNNATVIFIYLFLVWNKYN